MDLGNSIVNTPDPESETPTRIQPVKPSPTTNGVLKRHPHPIVVTYRECLKNHAASIGGHAVDGCGGFMPSMTSNPAEPTRLRCAACGCHRNFHRRDPEDPPALDYRPHHRHHPPPPPPPPRAGSPNNSSSPPPISSSYAPHMLLALSHSSLSGLHPPELNNAAAASTPSGASYGRRKRVRTKFTHDQKERMLELAERVGWKMQKKDEDVINEACNDIGVDRGVFKVWMHNNKNAAVKKEPSAPPPSQPQLTKYSPDADTGVRNGVNYGGDGYQDMKQNPELNQLHLRMNSAGTTAHALGTNVTSSA